MNNCHNEAENREFSLCSSTGTSRGASCCRNVITLAAFVILSCASSTSQAPPQTPPHPILLPQANRLPDINDQMVMKQQLSKKQNFDAANALRTQQIADETTKLLILAKDMKSQIDKLGDQPLPDKVIREAEVIEILAHDVQAKMTLTVGGG
jgi:hypothetical protein